MENIRKQLLKTIKSRGYWRINFRPFVDQNLDLPRCKNLIEKSSVNFRGWDYPHVPRSRRENTDLVPGNNYYEGWIDSGAEKEIWRLYQSGQFIHFKAMEEDWLKEDSLSDEEMKKIGVGTIIDILWIVHRITEVFEFAARLARSGLYRDGVEINILLDNVPGRKLEIITDKRKRASLFVEYKTGAKNIEFLRSYNWQELTEETREKALEVIIYIFHRFGWENPPNEVIKNDQERLITRRL
jgi:hypothetical protein